jgi:hypothetical protein
VVCVAGRNERLRGNLEAAFADRSDVRILGFTDRMSDLLAAADVLVHGTGGVTCLEASLRGCPVVIYGFSTGHVRHNAEALELHGLARRARTTSELQLALRELIDLPSAAPARPSHVDPTELVLSARAAPWPGRHPLRTTMRRVAAPAFASVALLFSTGTGFSLAARGLDLDPLNHIATDRSAVALVVDAPPSAIAPVAAELQRVHATASFAVGGAPGARAIDAAGRDGLELVPTVAGGEPLRWIAASRRLSRVRRALGLPPRFRYLMPPSDFTFGQYVMARQSGGQAIAGRVSVSSSKQLGSASIRAGDVVELHLTGAPGSVERQVETSILTLRQAGLEANSVAKLAG